MADKLKLCAVILGLAVALLVGPAGPKEAASAEGGTTYSFSGYIKTDMIYNPGYDGGDSFPKALAPRVSRWAPTTPMRASGSASGSRASGSTARRTRLWVR